MLPLEQDLGPCCGSSRATWARREAQSHHRAPGHCTHPP
jgi:hypothetical protein